MNCPQRLGHFSGGGGGCCGQLWVSHMICGQTCDELCHFTFYLIVLGFQPIKSALARHVGVQMPVISRPLPSLSLGPLLGVHFGESLVVRLYSEIDHIHLSSEAQCASHLLPQVDCHIMKIWKASANKNVIGGFAFWMIQNENLPIAFLFSKAFYTEKWVKVLTKLSKMIECLVCFIYNKLMIEFN